MSCWNRLGLTVTTSWLLATLVQASTAEAATQPWPELLSRVVFWGLNQAAFCRTPSVKILPSRTRAIW